MIFLLKWGLLSGICVVVVAMGWHLLNRSHPNWPKPIPGLLMAVAFVIVASSAGRLSSFTLIGEIRNLFTLVIAGLWIGASIYYWRSFVYWLLPLSAAAIFLVVPDTEEILLLFGILVPGMVFFWPLRQLPFSRVGAASLGVVVVVVILIGGEGRSASILVSLGTLGLIAFVPLLMFFRRPKDFAATNGFYAIAILLHALCISIVLTIARITPRWDVAGFTVLTAAGFCSLALLAISKRYYISKR